MDAINLSSEDSEKKTGHFSIKRFIIQLQQLQDIHLAKKHQDWFDENDDEIQRLLEEKHRLHKHKKILAQYPRNSNICKTVQTKLRDMQDSWLRKIRSFADRKDTEKFHDALKTIYGPKSSGATTLLSADGSTLLTDKEAIWER